MMHETLSLYLLFLTKSITIFMLLALLLAISSKLKSSKIDLKDKKIVITSWNDQLRDWQSLLATQTLSKQRKAQIKKEKKIKPSNKKLFVLDFKGDVKANAVEELRDEISSLLTVATQHDEILVKVESRGGAVSEYGLAASQLARIRERGIPLTIAVDTIAASGGYLMACVANKIIAAPFAIIGSIGVLQQIPNFHHLLKKHDIEFEEITAGKHKRSLTMFSKNTEQHRQKARENLEAIHDLFKQHIIEYRPQINLSKVDSGDYWLAKHAKDLSLVDQIETSDTYIQEASVKQSVYLIKREKKQSKMDQFKSFLMQLRHANASL